MSGRLPALLEERGDAIVARFVAALKERRGASDRTPTSTLLDDMPSFLSRLAADLRVSHGEPTAEGSEIAHAHGRLRWEQGLALTEAIADYSTLHEAILCEAADAGVQLSLSESTRLLRHLANATAAAAASFAAAQAERERRHIDQIEALQRVRREFLANLSHELRTPLHVIRLSAALLKTEISDDRLRRPLDIIDRNVARESKLVDELLDMAALATGRLQLEWTRIDVGQVAREVAAALAPTAAAKDVRLHDVDSPSHAEVAGDRERLYQCFWHLVGNAIKFTPAGGEVWLEVYARDIGGRRAVEACVRDTGRGLSPTFAGMAFDAFTQQDGGTTRAYDGLGIGLALVRHIVELHGATIDCESGEGRTCFRIRFPAA